MVPSTIKKGEVVKYVGSYDPHKNKTFIVIGKSDCIKGYISVSLPNGEGKFEFSPNELKR